jgi:hypothetical protein
MMLAAGIAPGAVVRKTTAIERRFIDGDSRGDELLGVWAFD